MKERRVIAVVVAVLFPIRGEFDLLITEKP